LKFKTKIESLTVIVMAKFALERLIPAPQLDDSVHPPGPPRLPIEVLRELIDSLPEPIYLKDRSHRWVLVNASFCEFVERKREDLLGKTERDFLTAQDAGCVWESDEAVFATGQSAVDSAIAATKGEELRFLQTQKSLLRDAKGRELLFGVIREIEDRRVEERADSIVSHLGENGDVPRRRKLDGLASSQVRYPFSDPLTQLPNRRSFLNLLDATTGGQVKSAAVFVINIDRFKLVNDSFGHAAGDTVILEVAQRLHTSIRNIDILGRLDGDDFIVLANDVDNIEVELIAEKMLTKVARPLALHEHDYRVSVSVGVAMFPEHGNNAQDLARNATKAMRWCKRRRRGGMEFYSDVASSAVERLAAIELKLPLALEQEHLSVHYQPILRCSERTVAGYEALVRWRDPELGELLPEEFIPIAEEMGLIRRLGQSVLDQACAYIAGVADQRESMWVNVSGLQLMDETLPIFIAETLQKYEISGDRLFLEITESVAMKADASVWQVFDELAGIGVRLVIDDFGTGFSNLARLKELPFAVIKIDQTFIRDLATSPQDRAIFRATYALARELNLKVVAEGVETVEQEEFVRQMSVDFMQGYRFGRALPSENARSSKA
jgi:diguanylate cyclase (GGDEF)-like protein/PAS domain S-box-containing protein